MSTKLGIVGPEELVQHVTWMRGVAAALVLDSADADDLTQEALEAALKKPPGDDRPVRPWLAGVMRNLARMRRRSSARRSSRETAAEDLRVESAATDDVVARLRVQHRLSELVLALEPALRETLLLRYFEELSAAEIARRLEIPAGTVRWRVKKALDRLRERLQGDHTNPDQWRLTLAPLLSFPAPTAVGATGGVVLTTFWKLLALALALALAVIAGRSAGLFGAEPSAAPSVAVDPVAEATATAVHAPGRALRIDSLGAALLVTDLDPRGTVRLEGQVVDENAEPVGGARVAIDASPPRFATTEGDGSFEFDGLLARAYKVEARAGVRYAGPTTIEPSSDSGPLVLRARPGASLTIEVVDAASSEAIAGAAVELRSTLRWNATTDTEGRARLAGVGPSWRVLHVAATGYAPTNLMVTRATDEAHRTIVVRMTKGLTATGRVTDAGGAPVAGARVWASSTTDPFPSVDPEVDAVWTDERGAFRFPSVAPGTYRFTARHEGHAQTTGAPVSLVGPGPREGVLIELGRGGTVDGIVVDARGRPVAGAEVRATGQGQLASWRLYRRAVTGGDGRFELAGLPRQALLLAANHPGGASPTRRVDLAASETATVRLSAAITGRIAGRVEFSDGDPVAGALLHLRSAARDLAGRDPVENLRPTDTIADDNGNFRFVGVEPGAYVVRAARPGAPEAIALHEGVRVDGGDSAVVVELAEEAVVTGTVAFGGGDAPALYTVRVDRAAPVPGAGGRPFALAVPAGEHLLTVTGPGIVTTRLKFEADSQGTDLGVIQVERGRSVSGTVIDDSGRPVAGARVVAGALLTGTGTELFVPSESIDSHETTTDDQGRYLLSGFDDRPIVVAADHPDRGRSAAIDVPRGVGSVELALALGPVGSLGGVVTRAGTPLADTVVVAQPLDATRSNYFVVSGPDGSFALDRLARGTYLVSALLGGGSMEPKDVFLRSVDVLGGGRADATLAIADGDSSIDLTLATKSGAAVPFAVVFAVRSSFHAEVTSMEAMRDQFRPRETSALHTRFAIGGAPSRFDRLLDAAYTVCAIPVPADPGDRAAMQQAMSRIETLPAACREHHSSDSAGVSLLVPDEWLTEG